MRLGSGIGCALFNERASASDKAWAVADDIGRGLTIPGAGVAARATFRVAKGVGKAASRTSRGATGGSARSLPQFTQSTIDDAVNRVMKIENDVRHIFENTTHNLGPLVNRLGGRENTIRAVLNAANGRLPANGGIFTNLPINVGGQTVILRGRVVNGVPRISTMFIP